MSKYDPLGNYLKRQQSDLVPMTFAEIERIIGARLPASARTHRPWWGNNPTNHVNAKVWLDAGYESEQVDMTGRKLVFRKMRKPRAGTANPQIDEDKPFHPLYGAMKGLVRILPDTDLTQPADPEWADRLDAEHGPEKREE